MNAAFLSTRKAATSADSANSKAAEEVTLPPGVR
jgi:hypothetical protein